ncbi:unnamed protein product [Discosporangium mesarthrocarpum]
MRSAAAFTTASLALLGCGTFASRSAIDQQNQVTRNAIQTRERVQQGLSHLVIDFDVLTSDDCARYLCGETWQAQASEYFEEGCQGDLAAQRIKKPKTTGLFEGSGDVDNSTGEVSTATLLSLVMACGAFALGIGFIAGYKNSPSFAYVRIPPSMY